MCSQGDYQSVRNLPEDFVSQMKSSMKSPAAASSSKVQETEVFQDKTGTSVKWFHLQHVLYFVTLLGWNYQESLEKQGL